MFLELSNLSRRRCGASRLLGAALLALALGGAAVGLAQADPMAGVTTEALGSLPSAGAPGYTLVFLRITMQPGANIPAHSHPGDVVVVVQSGKFGTSFVRGQGTVTRAAVGGADAVQATLKAGDSAVLLPGDSLAYGGSAGHTMSNAGDTPLVLLVSALLADGQPGFMFDH
ncbi:MAG TPA: cupin domain-containing protein [Trueperaceae bacterium]|nr:cupin domain-containing protein [Trueperaceae bacterium]